MKIYFRSTAKNKLKEWKGERQKKITYFEKYYFSYIVPLYVEGNDIQFQCFITNGRVSGFQYQIQENSKFKFRPRM